MYNDNLAVFLDIKQEFAQSGVTPARVLPGFYARIRQPIVKKG